MFLPSIKWGIPALLVIAVAISFSTSKTFHVERTIPAPPEVVWNVLIDTAAYPEWNPVFVEVNGTYAEGTKVQNKVKDPNGKILEMTALVETLRSSEELRQSGGIPGILSFDHRWLLEPVEGGTKVTQHEVDRGIGLWFWNSDWIEPAYSATNEALAKRVESMMTTPEN